MFLNNKKIEPYLIAEEIADYMRKYGKAKHELATRAFAASRTLAEARKSGATQEQVDEAVKAFERAWAAQTEAENAAKAIGQRAEQRYILSFKRENGEADIAAILADAKEIIDAIEKSDYAEWLGTMRAGLSEMLKDKPKKPEKPEKPGEDATQEEKDRYKEAKAAYKTEYERYKTAKTNHDSAKAWTTRGYNTVIDFLRPLVRVQRNALKYYGADDQQQSITAFIEAKAASFYGKPKDKPEPKSDQQRESEAAERARAAADAAAEKSIAQLWYRPSAAIVETTTHALDAGDNAAQIPMRMEQVSNGHTFDYSEKQYIHTDEKTGKREVIREHTIKRYQKGRKGEAGEFEYEICFTTKDGEKGNVSKLFLLTLIKANEQALYDGNVTRDYITFPLHTLIDLGFYSTIQSARDGFKRMRDCLMSITIGGRYGRKINGEIENDDKRVMFPGADIKRGQCIIQLNNSLSWDGLTQFFAPLPPYAFALTGKPFSLLEYIFFLARQNTDKIAAGQPFTIKLRTIQHRLILPNEDVTTTPSRDIKKVIEEAVDEIEEKHSQACRNGELALLFVDEIGNPLDGSLPIKEWLERGRLQVQITGSYAESFTQIETTKTKRIETAQKRTERAKEKALVKHYENQLKSKSKAE